MIDPISSCTCALITSLLTAIALTKNVTEVPESDLFGQQLYVFLRIGEQFFHIAEKDLS